MKKHFYKILLGIIGVASFAVLLAEGLVYYDFFAKQEWYQFAAALQNAFRSFLFDPMLDIPVILENMNEHGGEEYQNLTFWYSCASFAAPLCTATALFMVLKRFFLNVLKRMRGVFREKVLVFGYSDEVKGLLQNTGGSWWTAPVVHLVGNQEITEGEEMELLKQGITYHRMDPLAAGKMEFAELMRSVRSKKIRKIFVMEDTSIRNVSLYMHLHEKDWEAKKEGKRLFAPGAVCHCLCEEAYSRSLAIVYHDFKKGEKKKDPEMKAVPTLGLFLFDLTEIRMRKSFDLHPLVEKIDLSKANPYDVHVLIVGFGHTGEQVLRQCVNRGVLHAESRIIIDVVDENALQRKEAFAGTFAPGMVTNGEDTISVGGEQADGELLIRFHSINIYQEAFSRFLKENAAEMPYTYAAVCLRDVDRAVYCLNTIERYTDGNGSFPVAVKLKDNDYVAHMLDADQESYPTVFSVGGHGSDDALSLDDIYGEYMAERMRAFHETYNKLDLRSAGDRASYGDQAWDVIPWEEANYFVKWANDMLDQHTPSRMAVLKALCRKDIASDLWERMDRAGLHLLPTGILAYDLGERELLEKLESDSVLSQMMRMEHRRWCYAMLFAGWSGDCKKKNMNRMENPCVVNWEKLCEGKEFYKAKYDLLPLLMFCSSRQEEA